MSSGAINCNRWICQSDEFLEYSKIKFCVVPPSNPGFHERMAEPGQSTVRSVGPWGGPINLVIFFFFYNISIYKLAAKMYFVNVFQLFLKLSKLF